MRSEELVVPIVLGGLSMEDYKNIAPSNSYIDVRNFTSPIKLAEHLKFVGLSTFITSGEMNMFSKMVSVN